VNIKELFDLSGRVAIVTGGGAGLGQQMAQGLAEAGASIVLCSRKKERCEKVADELKSLGVRTSALACDVTNQQSVQEMVAITVDEFGSIDILINNAGLSWATPPEQMALKDWQKVLDTNLTGTFLCAQAVGKVMLARGRGKIINLASVAGLGGSFSEVLSATAYSASKAAVINLTKDLACKWADRNVQVNAIAPGWFPTHMSERVIENRGEALLRSIPQRRFGGEHDLKGAAVYLASDASAFVTGHVLIVDGGQSALA
jgi:NAD(P)-dependent dehydrogenase (short-subunit alcohol dehydrogenase family)